MGITALNVALAILLLYLIRIGYLQFAALHSESEEVEHEEVEDRELTPKEVKQINIIKKWAVRQRALIYDELNPSVKEARK